MGDKVEEKKAVSIGFVSLGCAKNLVDLQIMGGELHLAGFEIGVEPEEADVVLVNTCAFIEDAREEAISAILGVCELKSAGNCIAVIVTGCLAQRYKEKVLRACPEVDAILGVDDLERVPDIINKTLEGKKAARKNEAPKIVEVSTNNPSRLFNPQIPTLVLTGGPYAYLKISEGCYHVCSFCAIPGIRGNLRSRPVDELVNEARIILASGISELNLIAQDITSYGRDLKNNTNLVTLLRELDSLEGDFWIRLLYANPATVTDELLDFINESKHVCHYLDIPVQHSHSDILRAMNRADTVKIVPDMVTRIRERIPDVVLRTTCLVGFPGETDEHFKHLMDFIGKAKFEHLGAFTFSPEEGTSAYDLSREPDDVVAEERHERLMKKQAKIANKILRGRKGEITQVLLEMPHDDSDRIWEGRTWWQAPDGIDGATLVHGVPEDAEPGDFVLARINDTRDFNIYCEYIEE